MKGESRVFGGRVRGTGAVAVVAALGLILVLGLSGGGAAPAGGATPVPIHHVVVILQENHTFDNVLGQLCAKEKPTTCKFATSGKNKKGETIPLSVAEDKVPPVAHGQEAQLTAMNKGKMNGFEQVGGCEERQCYTQFGEEHVKNLWEMARKGGISDHFFSRDIVPSWGGHLDFFAQTLDGFVGNNPKFHEEGQGKGPGWGCDSHDESEWIAPGGEIKMEPSCVPDKEGHGAFRETPVSYVPTVADRIEEAGLTWGIYAALPGEQEGNKEERENAGPYKWAICPTFAECLDGPQKNDMHQAKQLFADAEAGNLPSFSILTPTTVTGGTSQHNGTSMGLGDEYIANEVKAIQEGPDGASTTIFIYYDDCGCFYDHLKPPLAGLGIRLPLVIVSPYAKPGFVDHNVATNSSILAYMESVLHVAPVDELDANAYNFSKAFNYKQKPTEPFTLRKDAVPEADRHLAPPPADDT
jgi:phospholipase C